MKRTSLKKITSILLTCLMISSCTQYCHSNRLLINNLKDWQQVEYLKCKINLTIFDRIIGRECK